MVFNPKFKFEPKGDQPKAIKDIMNKLSKNDNIILLGATGTGKTFTMANVINNYGKPTLVMAHNKSLANQLYVELKEMFPNNRVEYYISNFDFYQPEAFVPSSNTYLEKQSIQNMQIELMRNATLSSLTTRNDVIVVASVAAIYGLRDPKDYKKFHYEIRYKEKINRKELLSRLVDLGYKRVKELVPSSFSVKGDVVEIFPSWSNEYFIRIDLFGDEVEKISEIETLTKKIISIKKVYIIYPADPYVASEEEIKPIVSRIKEDLDIRLKTLRKDGKELEAQRLEQRINFDIEQIEETGFTSGIENYSLYFDKNRKEGEPPFSLIDYFPKDFLFIVDESHMTIPQLGAMYKGDRSRKETLVEYGFRLPSALDNRPLQFEETKKKLNKVLYVSATPGNYEMERYSKNLVEQIIRPTGLLDPQIEIRSSKNQIDDLFNEIEKRKANNERVLINTTSRKLSEDIASHYKDKDLSVAYLHYDLKTFERDEVLRRLRIGHYDAVVGINLLREGLDLPEVSLIAILDADSEGFLRDRKSLIQMVGRVSRNINGKAIFYANKKTNAMEETIKETDRRRKIQKNFNNDNNITPSQIVKPIPQPLIEEIEIKHNIKLSKLKLNEKLNLFEKEMLKAAKEYNFEVAIKYRDLIIEMEKTNGKKVH